MKNFSELIECKLGANESISLFSTRVLRIYSEIKSIYANFDEDYASFQMLRYLPRKFDGVVQNILRLKKEKFKFTKIIDELVTKETRLKVCDFDSSRSSLQVKQPNLNSKPRK